MSMIAPTKQATARRDIAAKLQESNRAAALTAGMIRPHWTPNPDADDQPNPQRLALESAADELYYGGAAGGGKSDLLLGCALTQHRRAVVFRRVYPNLDAIIERSIEIVGNDGGFNKATRVWRLPRCRLEFEACQHESDKTKQQGRPRDFYGFDEITEFTRTQYQFIIGWNRTTNPDQRCRVIVTGNPPLDADGAWVMEEWGPWLDPDFPDPAEPGELRWYYHDRDNNVVWLRTAAPVEIDGVTTVPRSRTFIPARLGDNPHLAADGRYLALLNSMPEPLRSRLRDGDFRAAAGVDPWQVIPTDWVRAAQQRWQESDPPSGAPDCLGVDVARGGQDRTALIARYGNWYSRPQTWPGSMTTDGPTVAGLVQAAYPNAERLHVDVIGVGSSAYDSLAAMYSRGRVSDARPVNVSEASRYTDRSGKLRMRNLRAELYWRLRDALDPDRGDDVALPPGNEIVADLCSARYRVLAGGVVEVESKEDIRSRLGRSPDVGDALLLAHYRPAIHSLPERQAEQPSRWRNQGF
jgi:hypothetical protein